MSYTNSKRRAIDWLNMAKNARSNDDKQLYCHRAFEQLNLIGTPDDESNEIANDVRTYFRTTYA